MRLRDLGALAVVVNGEERPVSGVRASAILGMLAIHVNHRVSADALIDAVWGERVTAGAASTLESHVWRLRQLLEPGRTRGESPATLVSDSGGFRLVASSGDLDSLVFAERAVEVRDLLRADEPSVAVVRADAALSLWRGRPFGALSDEEWARPAVARLEELHGQLREQRIEALVAAGALEQALFDLEPLVAEMPYRESLRGLQMLALFRSGRAKEALQAFQAIRRTLVEEIGTEPGVELQQLHLGILNNDIGLMGEGRTVRGPVRDPPRTGEVHLPGALTPLVGRDDVRGQLSALVEERRLVTIVGAAGCGKTRIAVEVARAKATSFPDGVWFVDLTPVTDPDLVIDVVISTIGFAATATPTALEDLRAHVRARRMLLVLDNCEHVLTSVARIVEAALDDADEPADTVECSILTTSREPIGVNGETVWTLEPLGLPVGELDLFPQIAPAVELFLQRLRAAVPTLTVDERVVRRAVDICVALDGLPLAIELAAARARSYTLDDIAAQVEADPSRLSRIGRGPADHRATVRSAIEWSHRMLTPTERIAHRRIAVLPGQFTSPMAATTIGELHVDDQADVDMDDLLAQLVHRSMLASDGARRPGGPTLFRQLATVRAHAHRELIAAGEEREIGDRRDAWTTGLLASRPRLGTAGEIDWYGAIDDSYATVRATLARHLIDEPGPLGGQLAPRLAIYWYYRARLVEGTRWLQLAHDVLDDSEQTDVALAAMALASALLVQGRVDQARPYVDEALDRLALTDPQRVVEVCEGLVAMSSSAWQPGATDLLVTVHQRLADLAPSTGDSDLHVLTEAAGCMASLAKGRPDDAVRDAKRIYGKAVHVGNIMAAWMSAGAPMVVALLAADPDEGIPWVDRLMRGHMRFGTGGSGLFIENRASFAAMAGDDHQAVRLYATALRETRRAGMVWPRRELTQQLLELSRGRLDPTDYERFWEAGRRLSLLDLIGAETGA